MNKHNAPQVAIDSQLSALYVEASKQRTYINSAAKSIERNIDLYGVTHRNTAAAKAQAEAHVEMLRDIREQQRPLEAIYNANPWSRFFLVTNRNGHIHSSLSCSTCFIDTAFAWLPELSGLTEAEAVAEYGGILCSVCFPSAPVEWTSGVSKKDAAEREARDTERAVKAAAKAEKTITNPDGTPLKGKWGTIATLITARRELTEMLAEVSRWSEGDHPNRDIVVAENSAAAERIIAAIAAKTGEEPKAIRAEAQTKADNKRKKEGY